MNPEAFLQELKSLRGKILRLSRKVNDHMAGHVVELTRDGLKENGRTLKGSKVLVLGLTFRGGVKELRHSRSIPIAQMFKDLGAETYAFDPLLSKEETEKLGFRYNGGFSGMDAAVITNDHAEFRKINWGNAIKEMRTKILIDAKQTIRPEKAKAVGFTYRGIGFA